LVASEVYNYYYNNDVVVGLFVTAGLTGCGVRLYMNKKFRIGPISTVSSELVLTLTESTPQAKLSQSMFSAMTSLKWPIAGSAFRGN